MLQLTAGQTDVLAYRASRVQMEGTVGGSSLENSSTCFHAEAS